MLISEAEGLRKPDPAIFARALDCIGVAAAEAVYVGDHPDNDVRAARAAGLWALWKADPHWPAPPEAQGHVTTWADLLHWIDTR